MTDRLGAQIAPAFPYLRDHPINSTKRTKHAGVLVVLMEKWAHGVASPKVPQQVLGLASREREVATIVYAQTGATARQVEVQLSTVMTNSAVRSMLGRLVRKGILSRRPIRGKRGRSQEYLYLPAVTESDLKIRALRRLSEDFFEGSLTETARLLQALVEKENASAKAGMTAPGRPALR